MNKFITREQYDVIIMLMEFVLNDREDCTIMESGNCRYCLSHVVENGHTQDCLINEVEYVYDELSRS